MRACLFCKRTSNKYSSVEHIFPEALGNKELTLPKGVVCDKCNNETLAYLDGVLAEFDAILFFRTFHGIRSKKGKVPSSNFSNLRMVNPTGSHINVAILNGDGAKNFTPTADGLTLKWTGKKRLDQKNLKELARALYKIGLELIYHDHGYKFAQSVRFDTIRRIILGECDFGGFLVMGANSKSEQPGMRYQFYRTNDGKDSSFFEFNYLFLKILFDLETREIPVENGSKILGLSVLKF